jgi:thiol-disulfide isomerase/thioredoxin
MNAATNPARWRLAGAVLVLLSLMVPLGACRADDRPRLVRADGSTESLASHRGRWVVVNYWAEWCAPCRHEIPELNALQAERAADVTIFGVNFDGLTGEPLQALATKMDIRFALLRDDPGVAIGVPRPEVLPTTVVIDPEGRTTTLVGPQTRATLTVALGGAAAPAATAPPEPHGSEPQRSEPEAR